MSAPLWELAGNFKKVLDMEVGSPEDAEAMLELLEEAEGDVETKIVKCAYMIRNWGADILGLKAEEDRLRKRRSVRENKIKRLKEYMAFNMERLGLEKAEDVAIQVTLAKNPESLQILDEDEIPEDFYITERTLNRSALTQYVRENPGCSFAWLESSGTNVRIK